MKAEVVDTEVEEVVEDTAIVEDMAAAEEDINSDI